MPVQIGTFVEPLQWESPDPLPIPVATLGRIGSRAEATTAAPHGLATGDYVAVAGAVPDGYNGTQRQVLVGSPTTFSYALADPLLATPATGTITATFRSDAQGGTQPGWYPGPLTWADMQPMTAGERLQAAMIQSIAQYRAIVHYRPDLTPRMRIKWTRYQETAPRLLEVHSILPFAAAPHQYLVIECGEVVP